MGFRVDDFELEPILAQRLCGAALDYFDCSRRAIVRAMLRGEPELSHKLTFDLAHTTKIR